MKNVSIAFNVILLALVIILFGMFHNLKKTMGQGRNTENTDMTAGKNTTLRIAYINADSINTGYLLMRDFKNQIQAKQEDLQNIYNKKAKILQDEYDNYMQKKQSGNISQVDAQKAEQDMQTKKGELDGLQQRQQDLMKVVQDRNIEIQKTVQDYIADYNKTAHFDYVLTYQSIGGEVLYANNSFDITKPIIDGLNRQYSDSLQKASPGAKQ